MKGAKNFGSSTVYDRNEQEKEKNKEMELKKTDIVPIKSNLGAGIGQ